MYCSATYPSHCVSDWFLLGEIIGEAAVILCISVVIYIFVRWCANRRLTFVVWLSAIGNGIWAMLFGGALAYTALSPVELPDVGTTLFIFYSTAFAAGMCVYSLKRRNG